MKLQLTADNGRVIATYEDVQHDLKDPQTCAELLHDIRNAIFAESLTHRVEVNADGT